MVQFPINVWIGWLPIVAANHGFAPNTESIFFKKYGFKVNLKLIDDPVVARDAFAAGESHILWGTLDMMALFAPELMKDSRTAPRIYQQIDWSNGGDGIVVRGNIQSVQDLKGKIVVYAQNSPSQYFINNLLLNAGHPARARSSHKYTATAFEAAAAFVADKRIDACVSWAPDIYNIPEKVHGHAHPDHHRRREQAHRRRLGRAGRLRQGPPGDRQGSGGGHLRGHGPAQGRRASRPRRSSGWPRATACRSTRSRAMQNDAHSTNFAENKEFFLNQNDPANFERTWKNVTFVYRELGLIGTPGPLRRGDGLLGHQAARRRRARSSTRRTSTGPPSRPTSFSKVQAEAPILTQTIRINFYPNSANIYEPQHDELGSAVRTRSTTPRGRHPREGGAPGRPVRAGGDRGGRPHRLLDEGEGCRYEDVKQLSLDRATSVKQALVKKYKFDPNKFVVEGKAWDAPADPDDPNNHALNRRVEISVYPPEAK